MASGNAEGQKPLEQPTSSAGRGQDEFICTTCHKYLTDPVTIECGHNFCRVCEGAEMASCPQCGKRLQERAFRPNMQLGSLVQPMKQMRKKRWTEDVCTEHGKALGWFCKDDGKALCEDCKGSPAHCRHTVVQMGKAAFETKDVKGMLARSEQARQQDPELSAAELKAALTGPVMLETLRKFTVDVTLDPDTANPKLVLSEDRKRVRGGDMSQDLPDNPERFVLRSCVLGAEGFAGGRRYWEVEVGDKTAWTLGLCRESVSREGIVTLSPKNGYWVVWLRDGGYKALTSSWTPLPVSARPSRVGVFLDYEAGEVSFYNVTDGSHLFTFTGTFSGTLRPYFYPGNNAGGTNTAPLTICPVPAQAGGNPCP